MSLTPIAVGMRVTAAVLKGIAALAVIKGTDQSLSSSTTLQNDNTLTEPLSGGGVYLFLCWLYITGSTAKAAFTFSGTAAWSTVNGGTAVTASGTAGGALAAGGWLIAGTITAASGGDTLQLQWAQNAASGTTTVKAQSFLALWRIS